MKTNDIILQTVTKFFTFLILAFSLHLFLAGHHEPGGGFIAGLMTASAFVLLLLAYDWKTLRKVLPINFIYLTASGLLLAALSGIGSFFFDANFLTHTYDYYPLPLLGETELATAVIFDTGVYFVVVGIALTIIQTIGEN